MRILHTSDLHLSKQKEYTFETLDLLLDDCQKNNVDLLTIGGDMFDKPKDVEQLRTDLRKRFTGLEFDVISISGNHDEIAYRGNLDFGDNIRIITKPPFEQIKYNDTNLIAVPYTDKLSEETYSLIKESRDEDSFNALLIHCTLDIGYSQGDFGEEDKPKYCPISSPALASLGYDVILGGHFHKDYYIKELGNNSRFVYPGSPVSLSKKELGQRKAALIETENKTITSFPLDTHFYDAKQITITPGEEEAYLQSLEDWKQSFEGKNCTLSVIVNGYGELKESEFRAELTSICGEMEIINDYKDASNVLDHSLFKRFQEKLENKSLGNKENIENKVIEVFSEMLAGRKIE